MRIVIHIFTSIYFWKNYSSAYVYVLLLAFWGRWHCVTDVACPSSLVGTTLGGFPFPPFSPFSLFLGIYGWRNILYVYFVLFFFSLHIFVLTFWGGWLRASRPLVGSTWVAFPRYSTALVATATPRPSDPTSQGHIMHQLHPSLFRQPGKKNLKKRSLVMGFHLIIAPSHQFIFNKPI